MDSVAGVAVSVVSSPKAELEGAGSDSGVEVCYNSSIVPRFCEGSSLMSMSYRGAGSGGGGDVTSENGSESSSYTSSNKSSSCRTSSGLAPSKKRVSIATPASSCNSMSRSMTTSLRSRSTAREDGKLANTPPDSLPLMLRSSVSKLRTPVSTPTSPCDGRWPSISMKASSTAAAAGAGARGTPTGSERSGGTLPRSRRRADQSGSSSVRSLSASRESAQTRKPTPVLRRTLSHRVRDRVDCSTQTQITGKDFANKDLLQGIEAQLAMISINCKSVQADNTGFSEAALQLVVDERDKLQEELRISNKELNELQNLCKALQEEKQNTTMEQSQRLHDISLQQRALEQESSELCDFLQAERGSMMHEMEVQKAYLTDLEAELKYKTEIAERQQKECRHLVRVSEQRRYENLALQTRLIQARELLLQQGAMTSRAAVALVGLNNRLDNLVDSLAESYDVSGNELEELVFYNEAYTQSSGDDDNVSAKDPVQPAKNLQKNRKSFMSAITQAIRSSRDKRKNMKDDSDTTDFLDSELEPDLMMENVLEDVMMPNNQQGHNMMSSTENVESRNSGVMDEDLHNLSLAILEHQRSETEDLSVISDCFADRTAISDCFADLTLVDRVINIDNAVTKLLKMLRVVQLENESNKKQDEITVTVTE